MRAVKPGISSRPDEINDRRREDFSLSNSLIGGTARRDDLSATRSRGFATAIDTLLPSRSRFCDFLECLPYVHPAEVVVFDFPDGCESLADPHGVGKRVAQPPPELPAAHRRHRVIDDMEEGALFPGVPESRE